MTLSEELAWRGFVNQTTYKDPWILDKETVKFYLGVDPSAPSMTIGNLAAIMMVRHFIDHGHKAVLLVGGATGMIGDPDGKKQERELMSEDDIEKNKAAIARQYEHILDGKNFTLVDNYDWFRDIGYLQFLREVGKHVPMRQMLARDFVQTRLSEGGAGISYAEFSYVLIQAYDFLYMYRKMGVTLQLCGSDQWGNSIAGVDLIRRVTGQEAHVWSTPLVVDRATGTKFGKTEAGAVWLDPSLTSVFRFYQFWLNVEDEGVGDYLKIYTLLPQDEIERVIAEFNEDKSARTAQKRLAEAVTTIVHGEENTRKAQTATEVITGTVHAGNIDESVALMLRAELPHATVSGDSPGVAEALLASGLVSSNSEARRIIEGNAVYVNGVQTTKPHLEANDFINNRLILRKGKVLQNSALIEKT